MKRILFNTLFLFGLTAYVFGQTDNPLASSANCGDVTVYTNNGAYVKARNPSDYKNYTVAISFTETYLKNGKKLSVLSTYKFSIVHNEEKQLFASQNAISNIQIVNCDYSVDIDAAKLLELKKRQAARNR
jgi:hypothetical protein